MLSTFHIVLAMKPLQGNFCQNAIEHGVAGINIDGCRIGVDEIRFRGDGMTNLDVICDDNWKPSQLQKHPVAGRFPANLILEDNDEVKNLFPETTTNSHGQAINRRCEKKETQSKVYGHYANRMYDFETADSGSASRFFKQVNVE